MLPTTPAALTDLQLLPPGDPDVLIAEIDPDKTPQFLTVPELDVTTAPELFDINICLP